MDVGKGKMPEVPEFTVFHIDKVWVVLQERFGFKVREWKFKFADFRKETSVNRQDLDHDLVSDFYHFGNVHINPVLNKILCQNEIYPTFNNLTYFVTTGKNKNVKPFKSAYDKPRDVRR